MATDARICGIDNSIAFGSDPNNVTGINATALIGAINVQWSYPTLNAQAVAYVKLFRSTSSSNPTAFATTKGTSFRDSMSPAQSGTTYYYWIQVVSVNGTVFGLVGPASATARSYSGDIIDAISGQISASHLATSLRSEIEDIPSLRADLIDEQTGRLNALLDIEGTLEGLGLDITQTFAEIIDERNTRIEGQTVTAQQINAVAVSNGQNLAAIISEQNARVSAIDAEASSREVLGVRVNVAEGQIGDLDEDLGSLDGEFRQQIVATEAAIDTVRTVAANATGAVATQVETLAALTINTFRQAVAPTVEEGRREGSLWTHPTTNVTLQWQDGAWRPLESQVALDALGAVQSIQTAISDGDFAYASDLTIVEASVSTAQGSINTLDGQINTLDGQINTLETSTIPGVASTASQGVQDAVAAQEAADDAQDAADLAQQVADNAEDDAGAAQQAADDAQEAADAARGIADTAVANALAAQNDANDANDEIANYKLQVPDIATAAAVDEIRAAVGFCVYNSNHSKAGQPTNSLTTNTEAECNAAGHDWLGLHQIASAVTGVQIDDGQGNTGKIEEFMETYTNQLGEINSKYTVKIQQHNNGNYIAGGFGLASGEGGTIDAGFDVDKFWVGRLGDASGNGQGRYPFVVSGNDVYIQSAFIEEASITNAKIGDLEVDTLKIAGNSVATEDTYTQYKTNMQIYPSETSSNASWRHIDNTSDSSIAAMGNGQNYSSGSDMPSTSIWVGGVSGDLYEVTVIVNFEVGIKGRYQSNGGGLMTFEPKLKLVRPGLSTLYIPLGRLMMPSYTSHYAPTIHPYTGIYTTPVKAETAITVSLHPDLTFGSDDVYETQVSPAGKICHYAFMREVTFLTRIQKR